MNLRLLLAASLGVLFALDQPSAAEVADLPDLVPADTLAYVELHDPPALARDLQTLVKDSYLQHPLSFFAQHLNKQKKNNEEAFLLAWLASPEFIAELGDLQGGCIALTGLTRNDEPEIVAVLRTGRSRIVPLALRMILLEEEPVHCIARIEGVPIYQIGEAQKRKAPLIARRLRKSALQFARLLREPHPGVLYPVALREDAPAEEPQEKPEFGCFVSLLPETIAFGTTPEILGHTIRRIKGRSASPSLATVPAFRTAAALRERPGLFAWTDPPQLTRRINETMHRDLARRQDEIRNRPLAKGEKRDAAKLRKELQQAEIEQRRETAEWTFLQKAANLSEMLYAAAGWSLQRGEFSCCVEARMKDKQSSPLLDLLHNQKISTELLQAVPGDAFGLFALPLTDGANTLNRILKLADAYTSVSGAEGPLPSKILAEWQKDLKLRLGRDVLAKIRAGGIALHLVYDPDKDARLYPLIILEAVSEVAAQDLVEVWPRLSSADGKSSEPRRHILAGQAVYSLTDKAVDAEMANPPSHYGRRGKMIVLGWRRDRVAAILRESTRKKDLLNLPRGLATVEAEGAISALGLLSCRQLLAHRALLGSNTPQQGPAHLRCLRYLRELSTPMAAMPPTMFTVKRLADGVRVEFRQSELPIAAATVVDIGLTWLLDAEACEAGGDWFFPQPQPAAAPAPAIPAQLAK